MEREKTVVTSSMPQHGVMEANGSYNRHARIPASGQAFGLPLLESAAGRVQAVGDEPIVIADYGSSQGKNSRAPMQLAVGTLRRSVGCNRPILVFHVDQPTNDFNTLFEVLTDETSPYGAQDPRVFPCAIGRSFYESVLPQEQVHLGWCSYAAMWLSCIPALIEDHFIAMRTAGPARMAFERQAAKDWEAFLTLRARELRPGGRLVLVLAARDDEDELAGIEHLMDSANQALGEMVDDGDLSAQERRRMSLGVYARQRCELLAPFRGRTSFQGLRVECCELAHLPDSAWTDYEQDRDAESLASKQALFFRSVFIPSLSLGLTEASDTGKRRLFADGLEARLKRRLISHPMPMHSLVQTMLVAKEP